MTTGALRKWPRRWARWTITSTSPSARRITATSGTRRWAISGPNIATASGWRISLPSTTRTYTEGTAWQYSLWVPHDMKGLIGLMGKDEFVRRLNQGFEDSRPDFASDDKYRQCGQSTQHAGAMVVQLRRSAVADAEMDARGYGTFLSAPGPPATWATRTRARWAPIS